MLANLNSFICTSLNDSKYSYVTLTIQLNIILCLHSVKWSNNSLWSIDGTLSGIISNILPWTPSHGRAKAGQPAKTYIQQLCANTDYSLEDLLGAMDDRHRWWERVWKIHSGHMTWWWWWLQVSVDLSYHNDRVLHISQNLDICWGGVSYLSAEM